MIWTPELILALVNLGMKVGVQFFDGRAGGESATDGQLIQSAISNLDETERILLEVIAKGTPPPTLTDIQKAFAAI